MTGLFSAIWHWWIGWGDWGFANANHYFVVAVVLTFISSAVLEWIAHDPARVLVRLFVAMVIGALWPISLFCLSIGLCLVPFALVGVGVWYWQQLHALGREKAVDYIHERRERSHLLNSGDPANWGKPTPESLNMVERIVRWEIFR